MSFDLTNPTLRRAVIFLASAAVVALNKKLGLDLDPTAIGSLAVMVVGYLGASNFKEASIAHAEAAKADALANGTDEDAKAAIQAAVDAELARRAALALMMPPAVTPVAR